MGLFDIVSDVVRTDVTVVSVPLAVVEPATKIVREGTEELADSIKELLRG